MADEETPGPFAGTPETITSIRAHRERDGSLWTARDALIEMLRRIDRNEAPYVGNMVIVFEEHRDEPNGKAKRINFCNAVKDNTYCAGMLTRALFDMQYGPMRSGE